MIGLINLELSNSVFNFTQENNKFEPYFDSAKNLVEITF